jgi:hypothetical protein
MSIYESTRRYNPEERHLHRRENLISHNHLGALQKKFSLHFNDVDISKFEWVTNPFTSNVVSGLTTCEQEQLKYVSIDGSLKHMLDADKVPQFLLLVKNKYPSLLGKEIEVLLPFVATFLCKTGFSAAVVIDRVFIIEKELRVAVSSVTPQFGKLCAATQAHPSGISNLRSTSPCKISQYWEVKKEICPVC